MPTFKEFLSGKPTNLGARQTLLQSGPTPQEILSICHTAGYLEQPFYQDLLQSSDETVVAALSRRLAALVQHLYRQNTPEIGLERQISLVASQNAILANLLLLNLATSSQTTKKQE